mgnify:FL=1
MNKRHSWLLGRLAVLLVCLGLLIPPPAAAAEVCFTAVNDNVLPLTADTMPIWYKSLIYVPYTVFDSGSTGVDLGLSSTYDPSTATVSVYNLRQILAFDLNAGTCRDLATDTYYDVRAVMRNGRPYVPLNTVCTFFGLSRSYNSIRQGYLLRIKNEAVVLSDSKFIEAAENLLNMRLREYNRSLNPGSDTPSTPSTDPAVEEPVTASDVSVYLAFRCTDGDSLADLLDALDAKAAYAVFFLTPQVLEEHGDLVRRMLGEGHSVGLLALGDTADQTRRLLERGSELLAGTAHSRTTLAMVPDEQRAALSAQGWVCWQQSLSLSPTLSSGVNTFSANTLRRLDRLDRQTVYLTMDADPGAVRVLPTLLRQMKNNHYLIRIPMETRL